MLRNKLFILMTALSAVGFTMAARASASAVDTGLTFNGQLGYAQNNIGYKSHSFPVRINKGNLFYGGGIGFQYSFIPSTLAGGLEVDVMYGNALSKISPDTGGSDKISTLLTPILVTLTYQTDVNVNLFLKGGVAYNKIRVKSSGNTLMVNWNNSWAPTAAAGIGYNIPGTGMNIFAQYIHVFGKKEVSYGSSSDLANIDAITAGISYTFGV